MMAYNAALAVTGTFTVGVAATLSYLPPDGVGGPATMIVPAIIVYGVLANVCYTFGSFAEVIAARLWGPKLLPVGPSLFRMGLTFSIGLTLLPCVILGIDWGVRLLKWML